MPVKTFRPLTPSTRYISIADFSDITKSKPEKSLVEIRKKTGGRNHYGRVTARGIGGGHKQKIRLVDFKRNKHGVEATVAAIEYDPMRSARLALLQYKDPLFPAHTHHFLPLSFAINRIRICRSLEADF